MPCAAFCAVTLGEAADTTPYHENSRHTHPRFEPRKCDNKPQQGGDAATGKLYSAGLHPWDTDAPDADKAIDRLEIEAASPLIAAIGEAGLDRLRGAHLDRQMQFLRLQLEISRKTQKPIILHIVKAFAEIIRLHKELKPEEPWIIHGFRGKPQLARQLVDEGFYLSLGERFNSESASVIPSSRLLVESDESQLPIEQIAAAFPQLDPALPYRLLRAD